MIIIMIIDWAAAASPLLGALTAWPLPRTRLPAIYDLLLPTTTTTTTTTYLLLLLLLLPTTTTTTTTSTMIYYTRCY